MLNWLKKKIITLIEEFDFVITRKSTAERSDNPIEIIKALFYDLDIYTIIDGGASIGDTFKICLKRFQKQKFILSSLIQNFLV